MTTAPVPHILLVDDDELIRMLTTRSFKKNGWTVVEAESGEAALRILPTANPPVTAIVADLSMPGMGGVALCKALRELPQYKHLPIIILSGMESEGARLEALEAGATAYLLKQADWQAVSQAISRYIS